MHLPSNLRLVPGSAHSHCAPGGRTNIATCVDTSAIKTWYFGAHLMCALDGRNFNIGSLFGTYTYMYTIHKNIKFFYQPT